MRQSAPFPLAPVSWALLLLLGPSLWMIGFPLLFVVGIVLIFAVLLMPRRFAVVVLVPVFGFLLAAFPARNSDAWMHLAYGKLLAQGEVGFGPDPFTYTTSNVVWVNHAWLADLLGYGIYALAKGPALILVKAILIAGPGRPVARPADGPGTVPGSPRPALR